MAASAAGCERFRPRQARAAAPRAAVDRPAGLDALADPRAADPAVEAGRWDWDYDPDPYPDLATRPPSRPVHLLGLRVAWHGPAGGCHAAGCPGCRGRKLASNEYCLMCERWGLDRQFATAEGDFYLEGA